MGHLWLSPASETPPYWEVLSSVTPKLNRVGPRATFLATLPAAELWLEGPGELLGETETL